MKPNCSVLKKKEYFVKAISLAVCQEMVKEFHYAKGGSNTAVATHGLFHVNNPDKCLGVAWWLPPTKSAALANYPPNWKAVLSLSRLVILPEMPQNAASFLIAGSIRLIKQDKRWEYLLTYADSYRNHVGTIYRATNWNFLGETKPQAVWVNSEGRMIARKAGPRTRTKSEMQQLGYTLLGEFSKYRYGMKIK